VACTNLLSQTTIKKLEGVRNKDSTTFVLSCMPVAVVPRRALGAGAGLAACLVRRSCMRNSVSDVVAHVH
jgi:hypothetical protein